MEHNQFNSNIPCAKSNHQQNGSITDGSINEEKMFKSDDKQYQMSIEPQQKSDITMSTHPVSSGSDEQPNEIMAVCGMAGVSGSMSGKKTERMKTALRFMIRKLSLTDRISIVMFNGEGKRLFPLRQVDKSSQVEIEDVVNSLVAGGGTNIAAGLQTGLKVIDDQCDLLDDRIAALMLMSDGYCNGADTSLLPNSNVPIYTFGFGSDHDPSILKAIADASKGGTFSEVKSIDDINVAFSQCLVGLVTVVVGDLKLTITPLESTIEAVLAGNYPQSIDSATGSVTVLFGDLYKKELRKVMVNLILSSVIAQQVQEVLRFTYSYRYVGMPSDGRKRFDGNPQIARITRTRKPNELEREEVILEEKRLQVIQMMKSARLSADENDFETAKQKLEKPLSSNC